MRHVISTRDARCPSRALAGYFLDVKDATNPHDARHTITILIRYVQYQQGSMGPGVANLLGDAGLTASAAADLPSGASDTLTTGHGDAFLSNSGSLDADAPYGGHFRYCFYLDLIGEKPLLVVV